MRCADNKKEEGFVTVKQKKFNGIARPFVPRTTKPAAFEIRRKRG